MGLLGNEEKATSGTGAAGAQNNQQTASEADFLNQFAGEGQDDIGSNAKALSFLSITQDISDCVKARQAEPGVFFNTGSQKTYGTEVTVVVVKFATVWDERDAAGKTVGRYEPKTLDVTLVPPPPGKTGFPTMINPVTGNKVVETFAYAVVMPDDPDAGVLMMTAGLGSMKTYRRWNTMISLQRLPNGQMAPIYARKWKLTCGSQISKTTGKPFYGLTGVNDLGWVAKGLFEQAVLPFKEQSQQMLLNAPTVTDDEHGVAE